MEFERIIGLYGKGQFEFPHSKISFIGNLYLDQNNEEIGKLKI